MITAVDAAATPDERIPDRLAADVQIHLRNSEKDHLVRLRQEPGARSNTRLAAMAGTQLTAAQSHLIAMSGRAAS
ncbi:hypothetical protein ABZ599_16020 [Streptomyces misionensis]|uniref:hypothetical protein n=1 Tax=Streptomyces misionensis TaxID=67331 RepID=UPI003410FD0E